MLLDEYPEDIPFLLIYKKEKGNLKIGMPKGRWIHQTPLSPKGNFVWFYQ